MKKRLSKLALLAVAAAFVLVGFPACGDDDESGEPPAPATATLTDIPEDGLALTAGKSQDISATVTVTNTTFTEPVKALEEGMNISEYITLTPGDNVTATAKLAEAVTGNTMKLTLTVTANEDAEDNSTGEIKVTLTAPAVTAYKKLDVTEAISYTVKAAEDDKREEKTPAATLTGNGVNLTSGDAKTVTATVTLTDATFADPIEATNFTAKAGDDVTITVTAAERKSDTEATLTLSMTAKANAADGTVSVTVKADALAGHYEDLNATGTIDYTVSELGELTAALACNIGELTADEAKEVSATVTLTNGTFAETIAPANFEAKASDNKVTITVTKAEKKSDTEATLTLSVKAAEGAQNGRVSVTIKATALANSEKDLNTPTVAYMVKQQPKPEDAVATLTGEIGELTAGKAKEVSATVTLTKGAYSDAVKALAAGADISGYITLTAGDKATATAKLAEKVTGNTMKITLTVTAGNAEGNGTITATLKAAAVTANKNTEATGEIAYTVKAAGTGSGEENPPETKNPTAKLAGEAITVTAGETTTATATVTLTDGTFAGTITAANFAANASNDKVTAEVTKAEKKSDTVATLTLSVTAADGATAGEGTVSVTVNAGAVKDYDKAISATGTLTYTVKEKVVEPPETVFTLTEASATINLGKTNVGTIGKNPNATGKGYLSVNIDKWGSEQEIGGFKDAFYNLSGNRSLTLTVKNVAGFKLYVKNSTAGRKFTVKIGDSDAITITHPASQDVEGTQTDVIPFIFNTGTMDEVPIVIEGIASDSVYPAYVIVYNTAQDIPVEAVTITGIPTEAVLLAKGTVQLGATVSPDRATNKALTWTSNDDGIATVDDNGLVTLKAAGTVTVTAEAASGAKDEAEIVIQAALVAVSGITVTDGNGATSGTMNAGDTRNLSAAVTPDDASNKAVVWSSTDESVATVDEEGVVTAVAGGTATIKATAADGSDVVGEYTLTVKDVTTVTYFNSTQSKFSASAVSSDDSAITGADAVGTTGFTGKRGTVNKVESHYYESTKSTWAKDANVFTLTLTLTAKKAMKIVSVKGECNESTTGNIARSIKIGNNDAVSLGTGKAVTIDLSDINYDVAENETVDIIITTTATAAIGETGNEKTMKQLFKDIVIAVE